VVATETAKPFDATPIATALEFRKRNRPATSGDIVDAAYGSSALQVTASGGTSINIADGRAIVQGALYELTGGPLNKTVSANGGGSNRTDWAVLTYDDSHDPGVYARVLEGTALTQNESGTWDMPLASWQKTPAGSIINLVDWRPWRGSDVRPCTSTARPRNPGRGQLAYEVDTNRVIRWNGSAWGVIHEDTGDIALSTTFPAVWESRDPHQWARRRSGLVTVELNYRRIGSTLFTEPSDASEGSQLTTLPAGLRPPRELHAPVVLTAGIVARIRYKTDGSVWLQAPSVDVSVGRFVRVCHTIPGAD
jgi:hypothetical protein